MHRFAWLVVAVAVLGCEEASKSDDDPDFRLLREKKLSKLVTTDVHLEASGVALGADGLLHIVLDDSTRIVTVDTSLASGTLGEGVTMSSQYEAIAIAGGRTAIAVEPGAIVEPGAATLPTDLSFSDPNKGIEGLAWAGDNLLALSEGDGRVFVLARGTGQWTTAATLSLPVRFADYADLALRDRGDGTWDVAVVSQESAAVWLGALHSAPWAFVGPGVTHAFPRGYCTVEGVAFLDATTLAFVSDRSDEDDCKDEDESVHVFGVGQIVSEH